MGWKPWATDDGEILEWRWQPGPPAPAMACVTTRRGGVSIPPYDSLNLGFGSGDDWGRVTANWERLATRHRIAPGHLWRVRQVHGATVVSANAIAPVPGPDAAEQAADAIVLTGSGQWGAMLVADCVPIFLWAPDIGMGAVVHSGWRGTARAVASAAVQALRERGARPQAMWAGIGPSIGPCCYEVDEPVYRAIAAGAAGTRPLTPSRAHHWQLDLALANQRLLTAAGIPPKQIEAAGLCTACHPEWFYSYRRDGPASGRMGALLCLG